MKSRPHVSGFFKQFPDEKACEDFIIHTRWPRGICCPVCGSYTVYRLENQKRFKCGHCKKQFTVRAHSVLAESKVTLQQWLLAAWLLATRRKGLSGARLAETLGVTQKTGWFLARRIREASPLTERVNASFIHAVKMLLHAPEALPEKVVTPSLEKWTGKIHCMDCIQLMEELPEESISVIVTSPPYNLRNSTGNGLKPGLYGKWPRAALQNGYTDHSDDMPYPEYVAWQRKCLDAMMRVLRPDGAIFYNHKWRVQNGLLQDRREIIEGFPVRQIIIWQRKGGINFSSGFFLPTYEVIYLIAKPEFRLAPKANAQGGVWHMPHARDNAHPAPFPVELAQRCISATAVGVVLDPFMGSGTTAIAAEMVNREWIGAEHSREYCKMAEDRIKKHQERKRA
jgi:site-specific DNA-methyltransferase (adenine-specific)